MEPVRSVRFARGSASLVCSVVPWDSETFGFTVAQVESIDVGSGESTEEIFGDLRHWVATVDARFVSCRLDHLALGTSMALEREGFRFVEMVYTPRRNLVDEIGEPSMEVVIQAATPNDVGLIADVASSAFATGRFALDSRLDPALGRARYADWVRRSVDAQGQELLKVLIDDEFAGFFLIEALDHGLVYWHLTALTPEWRGRGVGRSVWQAMMRHHRAAGHAVVETTVSGHNLSVLNLYARLGFSFSSARMTFHWVSESMAGRPSEASAPRATST